MKKLCLALAGVFFCCSLLNTTAQAAEKMGYVDLSRLFDEYKKTKDYDKTLANKSDTYENERKKQVDEVKDLQSKLNLMSDKEKESKMKEYEKKVKDLQEFDRQQQTDLRKEFTEKKAEIIKDIESAIKAFAEKEGYTLIFNEVGVLHHVKSLEVTDQVLELLNKGKK